MEKTLSIGLTVEGGRYGQDHYSSIDLPAKDYEIEDCLQKARMQFDKNFALSDNYELEVESSPLTFLCFNTIKIRTFNELNFLAKRLATLNYTEISVLEEVVDKKFSKLNPGESVDVKDIINLTYNLGGMSVIYAAKNDEELGQFVIENDLQSDVAAVPFESRHLLNKAEIGRLFRENEGGMFIDNKYVVANNNGIQEIYDGVTLPEIVGRTDYVFRLKIAKEPKGNLEETENTAEWIKLPIDKRQANAIAREHGVKRIEDCVYFDIESTIPQISGENFGDMQDFDILNAVAEKYSKLRQYDRAKYKAILTAAGQFRTADALDVMMHINEYGFAPQYEYPEDYFKEYLKTYLSPWFDSAWLDTLVSRSEGIELQERLGTTRTQYGFISARGCYLYTHCKKKPLYFLDAKFDVVKVCNQIGLFNDECITELDTPEGFYKYDLRYSEDSGDFITIEDSVEMNHGGSVLLKEKLNLGANGVIEFDNETFPKFLGGKKTPREFLSEIEHEETDGMGGIKQ